MAIWQIVQKGRLGENYNIGGDNQWSNLDLVKLICQLMDELIPQAKSYANLIAFVTDRSGHDWRYVINMHKLQSKLGWQPATSFIEGLQKTLQFYIARR